MQQWEYIWVVVPDMQELSDAGLVQNRKPVSELGEQGYELVSATWARHQDGKHGYMLYVMKRPKQ